MSYFDAKARRWEARWGNWPLFSSHCFSQVGRRHRQDVARGPFGLWECKKNFAPFVFIKRDWLLILTMQRGFNGEDHGSFISQFLDKNTCEPFSYFLVIAHMPVRYHFSLIWWGTILKAQNKTSCRAFLYPHSVGNLTSYVTFKEDSFSFLSSPPPTLGAPCLRFSLILKSNRSDNGDKA